MKDKSVHRVHVLEEVLRRHRDTLEERGTCTQSTVGQHRDTQDERRHRVHVHNAVSDDNRGILTGYA